MEGTFCVTTTRMRRIYD